MPDIGVGIIGGSGLYQMEGLSEVEEIALETPFGKPSDDYIVGTLEGKRVAFLPRHGRGHRLLPSELNFRANIYGFKKLGVERLLSASAVGSLRREYKPLDIVLPDQFIDRTRGRASTFFGNGLVAHVGFADPFCADLTARVEAAAQSISFPIKRGGTYVCMEGPAFSTRAESHLYRSWGADLIGMTNLQEAKLAREAEICYVTLALVTDYDCWLEEEEPVTVEMLIANLNKNSQNVQRILRATLERLPDKLECACHSALRYALITDPKLIPVETLQRLKIIVGKYYSA